MPQLRRESGKGAKLAGKVKVGSSSEEQSPTTLTTPATFPQPREVLATRRETCGKVAYFGGENHCRASFDFSPLLTRFDLSFSGQNCGA